MSYTPIEILDYVINNDKEADFMVAVTMHKMGYSIGEITDAKFIWKEDELYLKSGVYKIKQKVEDADIMIAVKTDKYVSAFISRYMDAYQLHFLVHDCATEDKALYEDAIAIRVIQYIILKTIKQLRLDTPAKIDSFIKV